MTDEQVVEWLLKAVACSDETRPGLMKIQQFEGMTAASDGYRMHVCMREDLPIPDEYRVTIEAEDMSDRFYEIVNAWGYGMPIEDEPLMVADVPLMVTPELHPVVIIKGKIIDKKYWLDAIPEGVEQVLIAETERPLVVQPVGSSLSAFISPIWVHALYRPDPGREMELVERYWLAETFQKRFWDAEYRLVDEHDSREPWCQKELCRVRKKARQAGRVMLTVEAEVKRLGWFEPMEDRLPTEF